MVKIKLCGMTSLDDCEAAVDAGADLVGFVFYRRSRRAMTPDGVRRITDRLAGRARTVGVFVEESDPEIDRILGYCRLDLAQVYRGRALPGRIRAYRVGRRLPVTAGDGLVLFDSDTPGVGGSGLPFDRSLLIGCPALSRSFVAGGVDEGNVEEVLRLGPYGIDLASAVEAYPGRKDRRRMEAFVKKVRRFRI